MKRHAQRVKISQQKALCFKDQVGCREVVAGDSANRSRRTSVFLRYTCDWTFSTFCSMASGFNSFYPSLSPFSTFNFSLPLSCFLFFSTAPASACLHHPLTLSVFTKQLKGPTFYLLPALSSPHLSPTPFPTLSHLFRSQAL